MSTNDNNAPDSNPTRMARIIRRSDAPTQIVQAPVHEYRVFVPGIPFPMREVQARRLIRAARNRKCKVPELLAQILHDWAQANSPELDGEEDTAKTEIAPLDE
jgi:hypothetical protein